MSTKPLKTLNGVNGQIELYPDKVIIRRKGFMAKMTQGFLQGDKTIYISQITGIKVKRGGFVTNGYIQFVLGGNLEFKSGIFQKTGDENTVLFKSQNNDDVEEIKEIIEERMQNKGGGQVSTADELIKFKKLLDDEVISQAEFDKKKKELLA